MKLRIFVLLAALIVFGFTTSTFAQSTTLSSGLVGHWKFDSINTSTLTTPDDSGTGNIGTVGTSSRLIAGRFGQALRFDNGGNGQFMTIKNNFGASRWTVSAWLNPDIPIQLTSPYLGFLTFFSADPAANLSRMLGISKDGVQTYQQRIGDFSFGNNPGWHHVVVTYDGASLSAYVDGTLRGSIPYANILANSVKRYIGANNPGARGHVYLGSIDEVRLYDRAITAAEVNAIYTNTLPTPVVVPTIPVVTPIVADPTSPTIVTPAAPTARLVSSFTATTDKTVYRLGETVRATATFTLDPAWVTYLRNTRGSTRGKVTFIMKDSGNVFLVNVDQAFDLANESITRTYEWSTPTANIALSGKNFTLDVIVHDASNIARETKTVSGLSFEASSLVVGAYLPTDDGVTVNENNVPIALGTSPDIFAGVIASQILSASQFKIVYLDKKFLATTTNSIGAFPIVLRKTDTESRRADYKITANTPLNLSAFNALDIIAENTADVPVKVTVQLNENEVYNRGYQGFYILPANSGPKHLLLAMDSDIEHCNKVTGTDDCPMSPRQAIIMDQNTNGSPDKTKISMLRIYLEGMPLDSEFKMHSMKALKISYAHRYLRNYIDKYGQNNWVNFPEKITSDSELIADAARERTTLQAVPSIWDQYGGDKTATGYPTNGKFQTIKTDGKWWLVNPLGNLMYLTAVTQVDYTLTPGYVETAEGPERTQAFKQLDKNSRLMENAFIHNYPCLGKETWFCGGTAWSAYTANLIRKYGSTGASFEQIVERWRINQQNRLREWGFNSITDRFGKLGTGWVTGVRNISFITQFNMKGERGFQSIINNRTPDVFDPAFEAKVNSVMSATYNSNYLNTNQRIKDDPYAIGTAPDNEIWWGLVARKTSDRNPRDTYTIVLNILGRGTNSPSKVAFTDILKNQYGSFNNLKSNWVGALPANINSWEAFQSNAISINGSISATVEADLSKLLREFADKYFTIMKNALETHAGPDHLFVGVRFAGFYRTPQEVIDSCAEYCDIISINYYNYTTADERADWDYLLKKDKPILVTEFYFDSPSRGSASILRTQTINDKAQGEAFATYARDLLSKPQVIGYSYHDMYDQPLLGSVWSENNLSGFVSETDRVYPELANAARDVNLSVYRRRGSRANRAITAATERTNTAPTTQDLTFTIASPGTTTRIALIGTDPEGDPLTFTIGTSARGSIIRTPNGRYSYTINAPIPTAGFTDTFNYYASDGKLTSTASKVTVNYTTTPPALLTLTVTKVGNGTVTATGINCGTDCQGDFTKDTNALLIATPAAGYTFTGWSSCTGIGTRKCSVPMNTAKIVTATFTKINTTPTSTVGQP